MLDADPRFWQTGSGCEYLREGLLRPCDPVLFDWLEKERTRLDKGEIDEKMWGVGMIARDKMIPQPDYFGKGMPVASPERDRYFDEMLAQFRESDRDVIFLDPDWGMGFTAREFAGDWGRGHLGVDEVARCFNEGFSVLFYQDADPKDKSPHGKIVSALLRAGIPRKKIRSIIPHAGFRGCRVKEAGETAPNFFFVGGASAEKTIPSSQIARESNRMRRASNVEKIIRSLRTSIWWREGGFAPRRVGVFIDAENIFGAAKIRHVLNNIKQVVPNGEAVYGRMFGKPRIGKNPDTIGKDRRNLQKKHPFFVAPCEVGAGKDKAELEMTVDISGKIMRGEVDAVIVFANDHLNHPIARIARENGIPYYGIGDETAREEYRRECEKFFTVVEDGGKKFRLKEI